MSSPQQARAVIVKTLLSQAVQRIDFSLSTISIDGAAYRALASLVAANEIGVVVEAQDKGVGASYKVSSNDISLSPHFNDADVMQLSYLVHECAHAIHDIYGASGIDTRRGSRTYTTNSEDEAAAYIAGALYYVHAGGPAPVGWHPHWQKAYTIAKSLVGRKGVKIPFHDEMHLRSLIAVRPVYAASGVFGATTSDGI
ncbi:hypothetical protein [Prosthecomicrobium sp. N25]|uniref:hypothetical protein n=1 Tax=Prosthecomicrobium sp. N25 TaxID=3129254 RepID=UPI003076D746